MSRGKSFLTGFAEGLNKRIDENRKKEDSWDEQSIKVFESNLKYTRELQKKAREKMEKEQAIAAAIGADPNDPAARNVARTVANSGLKLEPETIQEMYKVHKQALDAAMPKAQPMEAPQVEAVAEVPADEALDAVEAPVTRPGFNINNIFGRRTEDQRSSELEERLAKMYGMSVEDVRKIRTGDVGEGEEPVSQLTGVDLGAIRQRQAEQKAKVDLAKTAAAKSLPTVADQQREKKEQEKVQIETKLSAAYEDFSSTTPGVPYEKFERTLLEQPSLARKYGITGSALVTLRSRVKQAKPSLLDEIEALKGENNNLGSVLDDTNSGITLDGTSDQVKEEVPVEETEDVATPLAITSIEEVPEDLPAGIYKFYSAETNEWITFEK